MYLITTQLWNLNCLLNEIDFWFQSVKSLSLTHIRNVDLNLLYKYL